METTPTPQLFPVKGPQPPPDRRMGEDFSSGSGLPGKQVGGSLFTSRSKCQRGLTAMESPEIPPPLALVSRERGKEGTAENWGVDTSGSSWVSPAWP